MGINKRTDLLQQGTLELLVLRLLRSGALNGWDIMQRIRVASGEVLSVTPGAEGRAPSFALNADPTLGELSDGVDQVPERPAEAVEFPDDQGVAGPQLVQELLEDGAVFEGDGVLPDAGSAANESSSSPLASALTGVVLLVQGVRKIPVNYAKQIVGNRQFGGARQFLPIKVNSAGVMPIIFAQAVLFLPTLFNLTAYAQTETGQGIQRIFTDHSNFWYMVIYATVVIGFTFLYTALIFNPKQIADNLKQNNGFIPGVKPGQPTTDYIGVIMDRITLPGAILLAFVGILPGIAQRLGVTMSFSTFFGGTSLLIMVGVILDTLQQIETQLMMRQYDGLMKSGRIQGRQSVTQATL